jgi:hypothetical protein
LPKRRVNDSLGSAARSPMVTTPKSRSAVAVRGPTPHRRAIGNGARNPASCPGGTTTRPSGFCSSLAIFATSLVAATPTETVRSISSLTACLICRAIAAPSPNSPREPVTSRNASSIEIGSTSGVNRRRSAMTSRLTPWYFAPSTGRKTACGQSRPAVRRGIAEWTPYLRAS